MATGIATGPRPGMMPKSPPPTRPPASVFASLGEAPAARSATVAISRGSINFESGFDILLLNLSQCAADGTRAHLERQSARNPRCQLFLHPPHRCDVR